MNARLTGKRLPFTDTVLLKPSLPQLRLRKSSVYARPERRLVAVRAEGGRKTSFSAGFVIGGVIFGVLGFLYAPQISKALLDEQQRLRLPRFLRDRSPEPVTREEVIQRLDELHVALDQLSQDLDDNKPDTKETAESNGRVEQEASETKTTSSAEPST